MTENLPARINTPIPVNTKSDKEQVLESDLIIANNTLLQLHEAWGQVKSVKSIATLVATTFGAIRERRLMMGIPYASDLKKPTGHGVALPLD